MWGSKNNGYDDQMYRDRRAGGFENKSICCCFYLSKSIVVIFLAAFIAAAGAASVLSVVLGYKERWIYVTDRSVTPAYNLRSGWIYFSDNVNVDKDELKVISNAAYILGIVCVAMNCLSAFIALYSALRALCGRLGRGFVCFSVLFSVLLIGAMLAFYIVMAVNVYKYEQTKNGHAKFPWPDWAWALGAGSSLLWFISAGLTSAMPKKSKYFADEVEFQRQRNDAARPYQIPPPAPAQGTPVDGYVPSSLDSVASNRNVPPMASQENRESVAESPKKSFMPSWARRTSNEPSLPKAGGGSLKNRAEEIRDRYRSQGRTTADVELGGASQRPKSAW